MYEFGLEVSIRDIQLIYKIKKLLGVGTVYIRNKSKSSENLDIESTLLSKNIRNNVIFRIRNKSHLKNIILPIFDKYPMITNKQYDYIRFKSTLLSNIIYSNELLPYIRPHSFSPPQPEMGCYGSKLSIYALNSQDGKSSNKIERILNISYFPA
jgi:hypothetical protein